MASYIHWDADDILKHALWEDDHEGSRFDREGFFKAFAFVYQSRPQEVEDAWRAYEAHHD